MFASSDGLSAKNKLRYPVFREAAYIQSQKISKRGTCDKLGGNISTGGAKPTVSVAADVVSA